MSNPPSSRTEALRQLTRYRGSMHVVSAGSYTVIDGEWVKWSEVESLLGEPPNCPTCGHLLGLDQRGNGPTHLWCPVCIEAVGEPPQRELPDVAELWRQQVSGVGSRWRHAMKAQRCEAVVFRRDTYRYSGGKQRFKMHYTKSRCRNVTTLGTLCWRHAHQATPAREEAQ